MKKILLVIVVITFFQSHSYSQGTINDNHFTIDVRKVFTGEFNSNNDSIYDIYCDIEVEQTTGISGIIFNVGTSQQASDIFSFSFPFDPITLPPEMSWTRNANQITIKPGIQVLHANYFYEIRLLGTSGNVSDPQIIQ